MAGAVGACLHTPHVITSSSVEVTSVRSWGCRSPESWSGEYALQAAVGGKREGECVETRIPPPVTVVSRTRVTESLSTPRVKVQSHVQTVYPLLTRNYKISATVGVTTVVAKPVKAILDTGAGPNIVRPDFLPED